MSKTKKKQLAGAMTMMMTTMATTQATTTLQTYKRMVSLGAENYFALHARTANKRTNVLICPLNLYSAL
jgi:hypothetical protein